MKLVEQRILRGPNVWSDRTCIKAIIDFGDGAIPVYWAELLPELAPGAPRAPIAELTARLVLAMQRRAGVNVEFWCTAPIPGNDGLCTVVVEFDLEQLGQDALACALDPHTDLPTALAMLEATARRTAISASTAAVLAAAKDRGIPLMRIADEADLFQLGWGRRQKKTQVPNGGNCRTAGEAIVESLFGQDDGRIPVIAVTGTNGKTTTTLMIAHVARMAGMHTGVTTTEGIFIDATKITEGDSAGYHSARCILSSDVVDIAVLETARGGILKRGLAFDRCTVGVVLNVSADHLGLDGIETVAELAKVKAVVANAAAGAVVLNAQDGYCVEMANSLRPGAELIYFSLDANNPVLRKHRVRGMRCTYLQDDTLFLAHGDNCEPLLATCAMPVAMHGHARHNIANALAAAAALLGAGFSTRQIAAGLATFVSDAHTNPLRCNMHVVRGVTVIVDYAHNPAAYTALAGMTRAMTERRRVAVITAPGDRRDSDLQDMGRACALGFDELFIYEADPRGRISGATAEVIASGARSAGMHASLVHPIVPVADAFGAALNSCAEGEILVFACGSSSSAQTVLEMHHRQAHTKPVLAM